MVATTSRVYSVGYEGMTQKALLECLSQSKVEVVVDVRLNPVSRKPGFSKKALTQAFGAAGIEYIHEPMLGNPPENRDSFRTGDGSAGRKRMRKILTNGSSDAVKRVADLAMGRRIAVLCVEREVARCHRSVITEVLSEIEPELDIIPVC